MRTGKRQFAALPLKAIGDKRLRGTHHRVLAAIAYHDRFGANGRGCVASHATLAKEACIHLVTLSNVTRDLARFGYITVHDHDQDRRRRTYRVIYDVKFDGSEAEEPARQRVDNISHSANEIREIDSREKCQVPDSKEFSLGNIFRETDLKKFGEAGMPKGRGQYPPPGKREPPQDRRPGETRYRYHRRERSDANDARNDR